VRFQIIFACVKKNQQAFLALQKNVLLSTTMSCSLRGTNIEALYKPHSQNQFMSELLAKNLLGNMSLVPTNKLFKSPLRLFFECCGIARNMLIIIDETKVHLDFHIYAILDFELHIGHPLDNLFQEKSSDGSLSEQLRKTASATHLDIPIAERRPNNDPSEEVKFISPFNSPRLSSETRHPSPTSLERKPCPSGHKTIVLDNDRGPTLFPHDISLENENFYAMDILLSATCFHEDRNHLLILVFKPF
jgi:hypothetical protein